jgi:hypothetical protein
MMTSRPGAALHFLLLLLVAAGAARAFDIASLEGTHAVSGRHADGSAYEGEVAVRVQDGLVLMQWKSGGRDLSGTGVLTGRTLGVAWQDGVGVYRVLPQDQGWALVGLRLREGSAEAGKETVMAGDTDVTGAEFRARDHNGVFTVEGGSPDRDRIVMAGGETVKTLTFGSGERVQKEEGLALGNGLAAITPLGLMVLERRPDPAGRAALSGVVLGGDGRVSPVALVPSE